MNEQGDIRDDEIRIIGSNLPSDPQPPISRLRKVIAGVVVVVVIAVVAIFVWGGRGASNEPLLSAEEPSAEDAVIPEIFDPYDSGDSEDIVIQPETGRFGSAVDSLVRGFCEIRDMSMNDVPLRIYIPHNADMTLHVGKLDREDSSIIYAAEASFIRADNLDILGAFVLAGEPLAWGLSVRGYCSSIGGEVKVGVADNSPLFEEAIERGGYFFRQYGLVDEGVLVENEPKNKSIRRAICERRGEIFMVESLNKESFHDFAQALVDLDIDNAVNLPGSEAYGWAVDGDDEVHEFGTPNFYTGRGKMPKNTNYIVWRRR